MRLVDVNILINVVNLQSPHHRRLLSWWEAALADPEPVALTWAVNVGFVRIATLAHVLPVPLEVPEALRVLDDWLLRPNTVMIDESEHHHALFAELAAEAGGGGNLVTDAHLAAIAIGNGASLASCDADFAKFKKLRWENPLA